jgi:hypothetical protein
MKPVPRDKNICTTFKIILYNGARVISRLDLQLRRAIFTLVL